MHCQLYLSKAGKKILKATKEKHPFQVKTEEDEGSTLESELNKTPGVAHV